MPASALIATLVIGLARALGRQPRVQGRGRAQQAVMFARLAPFVRPVLINGTAGAIVAPGGKATTIMAFTVRNGKITEIDILADPARLRQLDRYFFGSR